MLRPPASTHGSSSCNLGPNNSLAQCRGASTPTRHAEQARMQEPNNSSAQLGGACTADPTVTTGLQLMSIPIKRVWLKDRAASQLIHFMPAWRTSNQKHSGLLWSLISCRSGLEWQCWAPNPDPHAEHAHTQGPNINSAQIGSAHTPDSTTGSNEPGNAHRLPTYKSISCVKHVTAIYCGIQRMMQLSLLHLRVVDHNVGIQHRMLPHKLHRWLLHHLSLARLLRISHLAVNTDLLYWQQTVS